MHMYRINVQPPTPPHTHAHTHRARASAVVVLIILWRPADYVYVEEVLSIMAHKSYIAVALIFTG